MNEKRSRNIVGQVGANTPGNFRRNEFCEIDLQRVPFNNLESARIAALDFGKRGNAARVALNCNKFSCAFRKKRPSEPSRARADLYDGRLRQRASRTRDAAGEIKVKEKILA